MTRRLGRRSGAAAAVVTALLTLTPALAAGAAAESGPTVTVDQPAANATSNTASVTFAGSAAADAALYTMRDVVLSAGGQTSPATTCTGSPCPFSWKATFPANGSYTLEVKATETVLLLGSPVATTQTRSFSVNAPPQKPVLDPPKVTDGRTVELSWSRNTEPDMLYYAVFRKDPAGSKYLQVGSKVTQPASGKSVTFTDTTTTFNGGDFAYQVVAVRRGATTTAETSSDPSSTGSASVPAPPTSSTTPVPPGSPAGGPTTTAKPGPPAGVDLGGFLSSRAQPVALTPITVPDPPDTGFQGTLPFGARPPGDDVEDGAGQEAAASPSGSSSIVSGGSSARPLVPVAAGLILLLLAMHMTALNRRLKPAADGDLPVDLPNAIATPPVRSRRRRRGDEGPEPAAVTAAAEAAPQASSAPRFYDIGQESDWAPEPPPGPPRATAKVPRRATVKVPRRATAKVVAGPSADHTPELDETAREPRPVSRPNPVERVKRPRRTQARPTTVDDLGPEPVSAPRLNVQPTAVVAAVRAYRPEPDAASEPQTPPEPWFESEGEPEAEAEAFTPPAPFAPPAEAEADLADETEFFDAGFADEIDAFDPGLADEHEVVDPELVAAIERDDDAEPDTALHPHAAVEREAGFVFEPRVAPEPRYEPESAWEPEVAMSTASGEKQATTTAEPEPELLYELEPEAEDRWADPAAADEPDPPLGDPDEIEVVEVVSPTRRHLARSGRR